MLDGRYKIDLADSNMANEGSELQRKLKEKAAQGEPAWKLAGKEVGVQVWRIEDFEVVAWPKEKIGDFYDGDSYIILHTHKRPGNDSLLYDIYFWLGAYTSQDEAGTAAYKTVELDDFFGGQAVQHREVQGKESTPFLELFAEGVKILRGGVASGFRHVETVVKGEPRLFLVAGPTMRTVRITALAKVAASSLSEGDAFVLDDGGENLFIFQGSNASPGECSKASRFATSLSDKKIGRVNTRILRTDDALDAFWDVLGGKEPIAEKMDLEIANKAAPTEKEPRKLIKLSDADGSISMETIAEGEDIKKANLAARESYVLLEGTNSATAWVGGQASANERRAALAYAQKCAVEAGRPDMLIQRIVQGRETAAFLKMVTVGA